MDVNQGEIERVFTDNNIDLIIHGHTHRPAIHRETINGVETTRIVLSDWHDTAKYLRVNDASEYELLTYG
mgnify:FL=1